MIITEFYKGQGLGNQLACYVTTRVIAEDKGYNFGIMHPEKFKGLDFLNLDFGQTVIGGTGPEGGPPKVLPRGIKYCYVEKKILHPTTGADIRTHDDDLVNIPDDTKIDGLMQDEQYIIHHKDEIRQWLKVKEEHECFEYSDDNTCVINFRGGEYARVKDFFLDIKYWKNAINHMLKINPNFRFVVITDDVSTAKKFFPDYGVFHFSIAKDYIIIKNAKYLILSNSSFAWFPAWLSISLKFCIAPKYWGRYNISDGYWCLGYNITSGWYYLDRDGKLNDYDSCLEELRKYMLEHQNLYQDNRSDGVFVVKKDFRSIIKTIVPPWVRNIIRSIINIKMDTTNYIRRPLDLWREKKRVQIWVSKVELAKYKKTIKVYDVFYFFNELDLLEIRLHILNPYVDKFVLVEGSTTFSGIPKESYYQKNKERYAEWNDKIEYYLIDDYPNDKDLLELTLKNSNVGTGEHHWVREFYHKESAKKALAKLNLRDEDIVFISDLDEMWNPLRLKELTNFSDSEIIRPKQLAYYYYLNNRCSEINGWTGTISCKYKTIKNNCLNDLTTRHKTTFLEIENGGWHFGFMGGIEGVKKKIVEYNNRAVYSSWSPVIEERIRNNTDYRGRKYRYWTDESDLPEYLKTNKERWKNLFR